MAAFFLTQLVFGFWSLVFVQLLDETALSKTKDQRPKTQGERPKTKELL
jgi:hypothetical protein